MPNFKSVSSASRAGSQDIRSPLWRRLSAIGSGAVFFACVAVGTLSWYEQADMTDHAIQTELGQANSAIFDALAAQARSTISVAETIAGEPAIADLVAANKHDELIRRYAQDMLRLKNEASIQLITFSRAPGIVVARVHSPGDFGDDLRSRREMVIEALSQGKPIVGIETARSGELSTFAAVPLVTAKGIVGVVDVGTHLTDVYFERLKKAHHVDLAIQIDRDGHFVTQNATFAGKTYLTPGGTRCARRRDTA